MMKINGLIAVLTMNILSNPWTIELLNGVTTRVYHFRGFKYGLTRHFHRLPHAPVYLYTLVYPDGYVVENLDISEVCRIILS